MADLLDTIKQWQSKLTGYPEETFDNLSLQEKIDLCHQWFASHVIAEQMAALTMLRIIIEHDVTIKQLRAYFSTTEAKSKPLARFNYCAGIGELASKAWKVIHPLLQSGGYYPHVPADVGKVILNLVDDIGAASGVTASNIAAALYRKGLSPYVAKRTINTLRKFSEVDSSSARQLLQGFAAAREAAIDTITAVPEVDQRVEAVVESAQPTDAGDAPAPPSAENPPA